MLTDARHEKISIEGIGRRIHRIQVITITWMILETVISLISAWKAQSPALLAFGGDSSIELLSATAVLWRFQTNGEAEKAETRAARITGVLLFALAGYVVVAATLSLMDFGEAKVTYLGIAILMAAVLFMPWLAAQKRKLSSLTHSAALRADTAESLLCSYLSAVALIGVGVNAVWGVRWADPVAALVIIPLIVREGLDAIRGKACNC